MVVLKNAYLFLSNPKTNCWLGTIDAFLVITVKDVLYVLICNKCNFFYTWQTEELKQRRININQMLFILITVTVKNVQSILKLAQKWKNHISIFTAFLFEENKYLREFKERRYIMNWEPQLNSYK